MVKYFSVFLFFVTLFFFEKNSKAQMKIGDSAQNIILPDTSGKWFNMAKYADKLLLVEFWASWCSPCKIYMPQYKELYHKYHDKGLEIIAVSIDKNFYSWLQAIKDNELPFIHVNDAYGFQGKNILNYKVHYIPQKFLVYKNKIIADGTFDMTQIENKITEILPQLQLFDESGYLELNSLKQK